MRRSELLVWPAAIALGIAAEAHAFSWDEPKRWLPDLVVGWMLVACGALAWRRGAGRGAGVLLVITGVAWFLGNFSADLLYLHRGPLVHLLLTYAGWRPRTRLDLVAIAAGYAAAVAAPVWQSDSATIVIALALIAVAARGCVAAAAVRARRERLVALAAVAALGAVLAGGGAARLAFAAGDAAEPALYAYQGILVAVAAGLYARLRGPAASAVADLVIELGETRSGLLRDRLARALGDPTLEVGYWSADAGAYLGDAGGLVALPGHESGRSVTRVEREGRPFAVLVHDPAVLRDPALVEAVASATRLAASNIALQTEVLAQADELIASRRRLVAAADLERRRLEARLREGPQQRLADLGLTLGRAAPHGGQGTEHLERARSRLSRTLDELHELALGLHPRVLVEAGLAGALASLAERGPVPVELDVRAAELPDELEATVYFICAEALANVAKYASASHVAIAVATDGNRLGVLVADDGSGGADATRGSGLQGLADRVEALGGTLLVESPPGGGTRLAAEIPLGGETR